MKIALVEKFLIYLRSLLITESPYGEITSTIYFLLKQFTPTYRT